MWDKPIDTDSSGEEMMDKEDNKEITPIPEENKAPEDDKQKKNKHKT